MPEEETGSPGENSVSLIPEIPDYESNWQKLQDQNVGFFTPADYQEVNKIIMEFWGNDANSVSQSVSELSAAMKDANLPELERSEAEEYLNGLKEPYEFVIGHIAKIADGEKYDWEVIEEVSKKASKLMGHDLRFTGQIVALVNVLNEKDIKKVDMPKTRRKIAWHALKEIGEVGYYRQLDYIGAEYGDDVVDRSTIDDTPDEAAELENAVEEDDFWSKREIEEMRKIYHGLRDIINSDDNRVDTDLLEPLEDIWEAGSKGKGTHKYSAIHFLILAEEVYQGIQNGGGFDPDVELEGDEE